jgi:crotonobetainyl-CoA:carnitine CoA-transferase CaiB-like acyl-CoA transferase
MRGNERAWLIPALKEVIGRLPQEEVARRCERANISWSPVAQPADLFADAHLLATGGLLDVFIARAGSEGKLVGLPTLPVEFGAARERPGLHRQPPRLGEHNAQVLAEAGFSRAEIAALWEAKVIAAATPAA